MIKLLSILTATLISISGLIQENLPYGTSVGILAVSATGDTLVSVRKDINFIPASNVKLITAGTALHQLGAGYRFETELACSGKVRDSVLLGDLYIIGNGDPTTASSHCGTVADTLFSQWAQMLRDKGIKSIQGNIVGDGRAITTPDHPGWEAGDLGFYYGTAPGALNFYENAQDFTVKPGITIGGGIHITPVYPITPWMTYISKAVTSPRGKGDQLLYECSGIVPTGIFKGHLASGLPLRTEKCINRYPELTIATYFRQYLIDTGISVSGAALDINDENLLRERPGKEGFEYAAEKTRLKALGSSCSPSLKEILADCMRRSDNFYAEAVFQAMGREMTGSIQADSCVKAETAILQTLGLDSGHIRLKDGCGMSRTNMISPDWMVSFLRNMAASPLFPDFLETLPHAGEGTLLNCLRNSSPACRNRVRMKSGSMGGVLCYSGYILSPDGNPDKTVAFSIMINSSPVPVRKLVTFTDNVICGLMDQQ